MPCDSIITNSVNMPAMQPAITVEALRAPGALSIHEARGVVSFTLDNARCTLRDGLLEVVRGYGDEGTMSDGQLADYVKRAYSVQVVKIKAKQNGWKVQQVGERRYKVTR